MQTSVVAYPRIGKNRELKFALDQYFRGAISAEELNHIGKEIRFEQWKIQSESGIDWIPSNDFSFYDHLLDTAFLFNLIPKPYQELKLSPLDTYFAMARGYQGEAGDVSPLAMKKWFNTNYHYLVPEIEDDTEIRLVGTKILDEFTEAKNELHLVTKPVIVGPFTLLKLARYLGKKEAFDFVPSAVDAYGELLTKLNQAGATWIQFDEPYLVHDLDAKDLELFAQLYTKILPSKKTSQVLLQTYYGDVRDAYDLLQQLDFDGIGLDFIEGKETRRLVLEKEFSGKKTLFAGLVNGKNIWRNRYEKTLETLQALQEKGIHFVLSTSCSLLHVPYTLQNETKLSKKYTEHFAFAEEKLAELQDLKKLVDRSLDSEAIFNKNCALFAHRPDSADPAVQERLVKIQPEDFIRKPAFDEREKIQKEAFQLPLFPTTTIGSLPQTSDVRANRSSFRKGKIDEETYKAFNRKKIAECVKLQEELGLDVLVHGEFERNDMVEYFGQKLNGYLFTEKAWVQSYGSRCVKPPLIWGDISRPKAMTVEWSVYAQSLTNRPMKGMLTGPVTILNWSFPREDISLKETALQIALAIRDEVLDLEANGIRIIQIDEAALREKLPLRESDWYSEYLDWAIPAFRLVHSGVKPETQIHTHMCYSEFTDIIPAIDQMDADVITFEASRSDLLILDSLQANRFQTEVGPGVYDIHSPRVPSVEEIREQLDQIVEKVEVSKLWVNPDCGLKTRGTEESTESLRNLVTAAKGLRNDYTGFVAK